MCWNTANSYTQKRKKLQTSKNALLWGKSSFSVIIPSNSASLCFCVTHTTGRQFTLTERVVSYKFPSKVQVFYHCAVCCKEEFGSLICSDL